MAESTVFNLPEFKPYESRFMARVVKFNRRRMYYDGTIYDDSAFRMAHKLYAQTKSLISFLGRAVDLDVALIPGMMQPWELTEGTPQQIIDAAATLYEWSEWPIVADDWLEDGTSLGEACIKVVPKDEARIIQLQRLKPEHIWPSTSHIDPNTGQPGELALIVDRSQIGPDGTEYEYAEAITPTEIRTYRNGDPYGYDGNPDRYPNPLGFVPVVRTKNDSECRTTYHKTTAQLTSVNEMASYLADIIGRHAEPQWAAIGAERRDLVKSGDNVWFFPAGSSLDAIIAEIDIEGTLAFIESLKAEVKANLPELAFDDLRAKDQIATETLEVQLVELDAKIWKMRRRYDSGLIRAHHMAAQAASVYGISDLAPLAAPHSLDYKRPIRPMSRLDQIRLEEAELALEMQKQIASGESLMTMTAGVASEIVRAE